MTQTQANTILRTLNVGGNIRRPNHFERGLGRWVIDRDEFQANHGYSTVSAALVRQIELSWFEVSGRLDTLTARQRAALKALPSNFSRLL